MAQQRKTIVVAWQLIPVSAGELSQDAFCLRWSMVVIEKGYCISQNYYNAKISIGP